MKMADNQLMSLPNNCETINRNDVEVKENIKKDYNSKTISMINDNRQTDILKSSSDISTQEEAVEEFLAGDNKSEYSNDILLNMDEDEEEEIFFKADRILECGSEQFEQTQMYPVENNSDNNLWKKLDKNYIVRTLKRRSIKCLNKMQIMEDVREGCNVQPSSPGHADQGAGDLQVSVQIKSEVENGLDEQNATMDNEDKSKEEIDVQEHDVIEPKEEVNEENYSDASSPNGESTKRKSDNDDLPAKRLRSDIHENFASRDKILNEFVDMADCQNLEQIQVFSEQLLAEVKTLNELAKEKEREWNNIIHLKKLKEELLLRMQRKRQVLLLSEKSDYSDVLNESQNDSQDDSLKNNLPQSILKANLMSPKSSLRIPNINMNGDRTKPRSILPKPQQAIDFNGSLDFRQKQRPTLDVQTIIADYRQRHPESVPRRGRRIRTSQNDGQMKSSGSILNFASMALGSGAQVRHNFQTSDVSNELGLLLNSVHVNRHEGIKLSNADSSVPNDDAVSFKDMLQQFAKLSQSERHELIQNAIKPPPPYPEVTVLPVPTTTVAPTNSLLHGILTKTPTSKQSTKTSFSPTLARLLTAPERSSNSSNPSSHMIPNSTIHASNMSISEILSSSKARNEITITPVDAQYESTPSKGGRSMDEEEAEDSADRLVIDESSEAIDARKSANADNNSDNGEEIPQCQGCNQKPAQFVCAGCGNQWYCSRDCQVSAWDEHSEVCSG